MLRKGVALGLVLVVVLVMCSGCAKKTSATYPSKEVTLIVGFSPGGGVDTITRGIQPYLQKYLGVPVLVENKPGNAGLIAINYVGEQKPDGYTVLMGTNGMIMPTLLYPESYKLKKPYTEAFIPIYSILNAEGNSVFTRKDSPIKSIQDLAAEAQKRTLKCGVTGGFGTTDYITYLQLTRTFPGQYTLVPFDSSAEVVAAVLGGHCDFGIGGVAGEAVDPARLNVLAVTTEQRAERCPEAPTFKELGYPQLSISFHVGALVAVGTPDQAVAKLREAFDKAFHDPEFQNWAKQAKKPIGEGWDAQKWGEYLKFFEKTAQEVLPLVKESMQQAQQGK